MKYIYLFAVLSSISLALNSQNTVADSLFGSNSNLVVDVSLEGTESGGVFLQQQDGKILYGGSDYDIVQNDFHINMVRFDACGIIDSSFGAGGTVRHTFDQRNTGNAFALQPDGKIVCAGRQAPSNAGSQQRACMSRFNSDGSVDSTFNLIGTHPIMIATGNFGSVHVMDDGRILGIGYLGGGLGAAVARFKPDGTLDSTFNSDGIAHYNPNGGYFDSATGHLLPNGKIIVTAWSSLTDWRFHAMQLDSTGTLDSLYANNGSYYDAVLPSTGFAVTVSSVVDAAGSLFLSGSLDNSNVYVLKLTPFGVVDSTFGVNGIFNYTFNGRVKGMKLMENGNILLPGINSNSMYGIGCALMIQPDGTLDTTFGVNGLRDFNFNNDSGTHWMEALLELDNGNWIVASSTGGFRFRKYAGSSTLPVITESNGVLTTISAEGYQWYLNNEPIPNATGNSYTAVQNGAYTVMTTNSDGCSGLSGVYNVVSIGVGAENASGFAIYPNPSNGIFTLKGSMLQGELQRVEIKNTLGESVYSSNQAQFSQVVDIQNCPSGVYLVELYLNSGKEVITVIKTQ
jgi:uncharacterized delta-60 repeat protein